MNDLVAQLAEQAAQESALLENDTNLEVTVDDKSFMIPATFIEKFAELIVKESSKFTGCADKLIKHFGVE